MRQQRLAAVAGRQQPPHPVEAGPDVVAVEQLDGAGVERRPDPQRAVSPHSSASSARWAVSAAATASGAVAKAAHSPSPAARKTWPRWPTIAARSRASWRATAAFIVYGLTLPAGGAALQVGGEEGDRAARQVGYRPLLGGAAPPVDPRARACSPSGRTIGNRRERAPGRGGALAKALRPVLTGFDVALLDCPPSLGLLTLPAPVAADQALVPVAPGGADALNWAGSLRRSTGCGRAAA